MTIMPTVLPLDAREASYLASLLRMDLRKTQRKRDGLVAKHGERAEVDHLYSKEAMALSLYRRLHPNAEILCHDD